jgi:hypothetical protein
MECGLEFLFYWIKQDRQCTYNITLKLVHETIVAVEKPQVLLLCVCVRACMHARACHLWPLWLHHIIRPLSHRLHHLQKSYWIQNVCFDFLYNFYLEHFSFKRDIAIYMKTSSCKVLLFLSDFNKTWILSIDFRKKYHVPKSTLESCTM